jgi:hypothetical protein
MLPRPLGAATISEIYFGICSKKGDAGIDLRMRGLFRAGGLFVLRRCIRGQSQQCGHSWDEGSWFHGAWISGLWKGQAD